MSFIQKISGNVYLNDKTAGSTLRQLRSESRKLRNELQDLAPASQEFLNKQKRLKEVNTEYAKLNGTLRAQEGAFSRAANFANKYFNVVVGAALAVAGIVQGIKGWINGLTGLADAESDVMKTTGMTREEVRGLNEEFKSLNTRTARLELMKLAEEAGRLGMTSKKDIMDFVGAANQIKVALGDDLGDGATRIIGKMAENFRVAQREGVDFGEAMLKVGSALNELAASGPSQADYIVEFTNRLTAVANQAEILETDIMGIGALLDEKAMKLEMSATAVNRVILEMGSNIETYARMAGMEVDAFRELVETDANQALITFLEGLKANSNGLEEMTERLSDLDQDGIRAVTVLMTLADNTERLSELQDIANKSMQEGTSASKEYALRNDNLAGSWEKIQKWLNRVFLNSTLMKGVERFVGMIAKWTDVRLSDTIEEDRIALRALETQIFNTNIPQEKRMEMLEQLRTDYPKYFEGLDLHTAKEAELKKAIDNTVQSLINRRIEMMQDEKVTEAMESHVQAELKLREVSSAARKEMVKVAEQYGVEIDKTLSGSEQMLDVFNKVKKQYDDRKDTMAGPLFNAATRLAVAAREVAVYEREAEKSSTAYNQAMDARNMVLEEMRYQNEKYLHSLVVIGEEEAKQEEERKKPTGGGGAPGDRLGTTANIEFKLYEAQEILRIEEDKNKELERMQRRHLIETHKETQEQYEARMKMQQEWGGRMVEAEMELEELKAQAVSTGLHVLAQAFSDNAEVVRAIFLLEKGVAIADVMIKGSREVAALGLAQAQMVAAQIAFNPAAPAIAAAMFAPMMAAAKVRTAINVGSILATAIPAFKAPPTTSKARMGNPGRYVGGYTGTTPLDWDNEGRAVTGYHHANEYVVPEWMMMQAPVANMVKQLENIRATGGSAGTSVINNYNGTSTTDMSGVERRLDALSSGGGQSRGVDETALARTIVRELIRQGADVFAVREMTTIKRKRK